MPKKHDDPRHPLFYRLKMPDDGQFFLVFRTNVVSFRLRPLAATRQPVSRCHSASILKIAVRPLCLVSCEPQAHIFLVLLEYCSLHRVPAAEMWSRDFVYAIHIKARQLH
jgi:hypothetical protein